MIDAELLSSDGNFWAIPTAISLEHITIAAFDLMHLDGVDLRLEPLADRKARLAELVARAGLLSLLQVAHFDDGAALLAAAEVHGLKVSHRRSAKHPTVLAVRWCYAKDEPSTCERSSASKREMAVESG